MKIQFLSAALVCAVINVPAMAEMSQRDTEHYIESFVAKYSSCTRYDGTKVTSSIDVSGENVKLVSLLEIPEGVNRNNPQKTETQNTVFSIKDIEKIVAPNNGENDGQCGTLYFHCSGKESCMSIRVETRTKSNSFVNSGVENREIWKLGSNPETMEKLVRAFEHLSDLNDGAVNKAFNEDDF